MSSVAQAGKKRLTIPRWRSLIHTPRFETASARILEDAHRLTTGQFANFITIWRNSGRSEDAIEILDAGIATGSRALIVEGSKRILEKPQEYNRVILDRAKSFLFRDKNYKEFRGFDEAADDIYRKISRLKSIIIEAPRNSLAHVEISLLYSRLHQFEAAMRHLNIAAATSPDDRYTLRAITRFFTMLNEPGDALKYIWKSASVKFDPWVQSAELSAAMDAGIAPRESRRRAQKILAVGGVTRENSELAAGWITRNFFQGEPDKKMLKGLREIMKNPTENALAQSIWLTDNIGANFRDKFPEARMESDAHEARALLLLDDGQYEKALFEMHLWIADQPFQARAFYLAAYTLYVFLNKPNEAIDIAEKGIIFHPKDWGLHNLAAICNVTIGNISRARHRIASLEAVATTEFSKTFVAAAKGMLAIEEGRHSEGIEFYLQVVRTSGKKGQLGLAVAASIWLLESLARNHLISLVEFNRLIELIKLKLNRLEKSDVKDARRTLKAREFVCRQWLADETADLFEPSKLISPERLLSALASDEPEVPSY